MQLALPKILFIKDTRDEQDNIALRFAVKGVSRSFL